MADDVGLVQLAELLRALRTGTGLTLRELSRKVHVSDSSLSRYFAGQALPPWEVVEALADLASADKAELRKAWESVTQARKQARWTEPRNAVGEQQVPLWEPEPVVQVLAMTLGTGRRVGLLVGVALLVATVGAAGWLLRGDDHVVVSVPTEPQPGVTDSSATTLPATTSPAPSLEPTANNQPARLPPTRTSSATATPQLGSPSPHGKLTPSVTSPAPLLSGALVSLTNDDSSTDSVPFVMDVANWSMDDGAPVHLWSRRTDPDYRNQLWTAEKVTSQGWQFVNLYSGKCLERDAGGGLFQSGCVVDAAQEWSLRAGEVRSAVDDRCVEIEGHQQLMGAALRMAVCDGSWYQLWHTEQRSPG